MRSNQAMKRIAAATKASFLDEHDVQFRFSLALRSDSLILVSLDGELVTPWAPLITG
jgi:hypothetical protein